MENQDSLPPATVIIGVLNILIFFPLMVGNGVDFVSPSPQIMLEWGASSKFHILDGQWWRLVTSLFLHFGVFHLLGNMYGLFLGGYYLEKMIGTARFTIAYFFTGLCASLLSVINQRADVIIVGAGASGAVFGIFGTLIGVVSGIYVQSNDVDLDGNIKSILSTALYFVGYNILYSLKGDNIDVVAHAAGLFVGFIFGLFLVFLNKSGGKQISFQYAWIGAVVFLSLGFTSYKLVSEKKGDSYYLIKHRGTFVDLADALVKLDRITTDKIKSIEGKSRFEQLGSLENDILPSWRKGEQILSQMKELRLSRDQKRARSYFLKFYKIKEDVLRLTMNEISKGRSYSFEAERLSNKLTKLNEAYADLK